MAIAMPCCHAMLIARCRYRQIFSRYAVIIDIRHFAMLLIAAAMISPAAAVMLLSPAAAFRIFTYAAAADITPLRCYATLCRRQHDAPRRTMSPRQGLVGAATPAADKRHAADAAAMSC